MYIVFNSLQFSKYYYALKLIEVFFITYQLPYSELVSLHNIKSPLTAIPHFSMMTGYKQLYNLW